ncbi:DUF5685 family protein [Ruminococcaceae bacterium OttesenSCG-928-L11]|nr:DUF5685 family protein [Ruminococcaceae bacterium OttesenSCG-928-L11]
MFGYIKPFKPELKIREFETYKAVYCGLCKQLGKSFGRLARATLSYDCTFLSLLHMALADSRPTYSEGRCSINPLKKVKRCDSGEAMTFSADMAALLIHYKVLDNIADSRWLPRLGWRMVRPFTGRAWKKVRAARPETADKIGEAMARQARVEANPDGSADAACEPTALALEAMFAAMAQDETQARVLARLGYLLGRFVYLCDALDDMEKDEKTGSFNPFLNQLARRGGDRGTLLVSARETLFMTIGEICKTCDLLRLERHETIIRNITDLGLRASVEEILAKKEKPDDGSL